jgi:hypothetical protein
VGEVAHTYNLNCSGGRDLEDLIVRGQPRKKVQRTASQPIKVRCGGVPVIPAEIRKIAVRSQPGRII